MQRVSVTTLEKFRRYMNEESSFDTEESLIESLRGFFTGNDKTRFGSAYHKLIEGEFRSTGKGGAYVVCDASQFGFTQQQAAPALQYRNDHPLMVHEMKVSKVYETIIGPIQVSGRIDGIEGCHVRDVKTKFRAVDIREYLGSSQWKFYLDMLELDVFWYDLFEVRGFVELPNSAICFIPDVSIVYHEPLKCERYDQMDDDLNALLNLFISYLQNRNFFHLLKPAINETSIF